MSRRQSRQNAVGVTAFADSSPIAFPVSSPIKFPEREIRKRVIVERPAPPPTLRTCPTCSALFEDHTHRHNTIYCRASCRVRMSRIKRDTAIRMLAAILCMPVEFIDDNLYVPHGLKYLEQRLQQHGYCFDLNKKDWMKPEVQHG